MIEALHMKTKIRRSGDSFWIDKHKNSMIASNKWRQDLILRNLFYEQEIQQIKEKLDDAHKALSHKRKAFTFQSLTENISHQFEDLHFFQQSANDLRIIKRPACA
ncbi:unnamed protein product [Caenorhabditis nigoni]